MQYDRNTLQTCPINEIFPGLNWGIRTYFQDPSPVNGDSKGLCTHSIFNEVNPEKRPTGKAVKALFSRCLFVDKGPKWKRKGHVYA